MYPRRYTSSEIGQKRSINIFNIPLHFMEAWRSGRVVGYRSKGSWFAPSLCSLVFSGHGTSNVKLRILECFTLYLRNRQSGNLRAIENCICGLRSIERNMRFFYGQCPAGDGKNYNLFLQCNGPSVFTNFQLGFSAFQADTRGHKPTKLICPNNPF